MSVPFWRLTGDHYLDTVPRLNDWDGVEKALEETGGKPYSFPRRHKWLSG